SGYLESKTLAAPDASGNIYYHYLSENWNNQGYGRIDKSKRQTALSGELSHTYAYYADATGRLKEKKAYSDSGWTTVKVTYAYFDNATNRLKSKTLAAQDAKGNIYYEYTDEPINGADDPATTEDERFGHLAKSKRAALDADGCLSYAYSYYASGKLSQKIGYSDSGWTTVKVTYAYFDNATNRLYTKDIVNELDPNGNGVPNEDPADKTHEFYNKHIKYYYNDEKHAQALDGSWYGRIKRIDNITGGYAYQITYYSALGQPLIYNTKTKKVLNADGTLGASLETLTYYNNSANRLQSKKLLVADDNGTPGDTSDDIPAGTLYKYLSYWDSGLAAVTEKYNSSGTLVESYNQYYDSSNRLEGFKKYNGSGSLQQTVYWIYQPVYIKVGSTWHNFTNVRIVDGTNTTRWYVYELSNPNDPWGGVLRIDAGAKPTFYNAPNGSVISYPDLTRPLPDPEAEMLNQTLNTSELVQTNDNTQTNVATPDQEAIDRLAVQSAQADQTKPTGDYVYSGQLSTSSNLSNELQETLQK
ncbi:MAG: hypothetical protein HZA30_03680, partial [Candidatus Omnitrophica bacterium]|nr:hypothetical protein [Candidatus Omnitrophota bacterium]